MSETAPSPTPAFGNPMPGPLVAGVSLDPALHADASTEPQAPLKPGAQDKPKAVQEKPCDGCGSTGARNLVICIDGTSNQFGAKNTNVVELYSRLVKDKTQLTFYNSGIGTYAKPSWKSWSYYQQVIANKLDLAFAL